MQVRSQTTFINKNDYGRKRLIIAKLGNKQSRKAEYQTHCEKKNSLAQDIHTCGGKLLLRKDRV